jgi:hypothetical protein
MKKYKEIEMETPENFKRMTGILKEYFKNLYDKTETYIEKEKKRYFTETTWCQKIQTFFNRLYIINNAIIFVIIQLLFTLDDVFDIA